MQKLNKNVNNVTIVIHPTPIQEYDILVIGSLPLLTKLSLVNKEFHLIKKSKFGGIPILILDTCDTLRDAMNCIKQYRELYALKPQ